MKTQPMFFNPSGRLESQFTKYGRIRPYPTLVAHESVVARDVPLSCIISLKYKKQIGPMDSPKDKKNKVINTNETNSYPDR